MTGVLAADATVRFDDLAESSSIYAKGYFGTPTPEGALTLDRYEAVYLTEMDRADVHRPTGRRARWPEVFRRAVRVDPGFAVRYLVYRDLRQRGYVVRATPPPVVFSVLPRGGVLHKTPSRYWVEALSERVPFDLGRLFDLADRAQSAKKLLLLALVDVRVRPHLLSGPSLHASRGPSCFAARLADRGVALRRSGDGP